MHLNLNNMVLSVDISFYMHLTWIYNPKTTVYAILSLSIFGFCASSEGLFPVIVSGFCWQWSSVNNYI